MNIFSYIIFSNVRFRKVFCGIDFSKFLERSLEDNLYKNRLTQKINVSLKGFGTFLWALYSQEVELRVNIALCTEGLGEL